MADDALIDMTYQYMANISRGRTRGTFLTGVRANGQVMVRTVDASSAASVIEIHWGADARPATMAWRSFEGALWRPLVDHRGNAMIEPGGFEERQAASKGEGGLKGLNDWHDYPFRVHAPGRVENGWPPFTGFGEDDPDIQVRKGDREGAYVIAQAHAADNLILVDGVMHMRSEPPVWAVGHDMPWTAPNLVRLVMPDYEGHGRGMATFPLDREEDALAFAALHAERVEGQEWYRRLNYPRDLAVEREDVAVSHHAMDFPDTRAADMARLARFADENLRSVEVGKLTRAFRKGYGDFGFAVDELSKGGDLEAVEAGAEAMISAADPQWNHTWPALGTAVEAVRALSLRAEFESARAILEEDAGAFVGPGL